jgi:hypothetical protein
MPPIKNWKKTGEHTWTHRETGQKIKVRKKFVKEGSMISKSKRKTKDKGYVVTWYSSSGNVYRNVTRPISSESTAHRHAVNWMRRHPTVDKMELQDSPLQY